MHQYRMILNPNRLFMLEGRTVINSIKSVFCLVFIAKYCHCLFSRIQALIAPRAKTK